MPLQSTNPVSDPDSKTYPYYALHLSVAPIWEEKNIRGPLNLRLVPFDYLPDGTVVKYEAGAKYVSVFDVFTQAQKDPALGKALMAIMTAVQEYVVDKGL